MIDNSWLVAKHIRWIALVSIAIAVFHLLAETVYTLRYGQTVAGYLPDLVAVGLLLVGGIVALKDPRARGVLCGAWGFTCCLHYRAWAWRFEAVPSKSMDAVDETLLQVLGATLVMSVGFFVATLFLCVPKTIRGDQE